MICIKKNEISNRIFPSATFQPVDNGVILTLVSAQTNSILKQEFYNSSRKAYLEYEVICKKMIAEVEKKYGKEEPEEVDTQEEDED